MFGSFFLFLELWKAAWFTDKVCCQVTVSNQSW